MKRLYAAICTVLESTARYIDTAAEALDEPEPMDSESLTDHERSFDIMPHELHAANSHDSIDNDYGAIGFSPRRR